MRSTGEACSVGISTVGWLLLKLFKLSARTSRPLGVVGRERPPPPALPRDSRRTRCTGPLFLLLLLLTWPTLPLIPTLPPTLLLTGMPPFKGSELVGLFEWCFEADGADISWIGSKLDDLIGDPRRIGCGLTTVTPAAEACKIKLLFVTFGYWEEIYKIKKKLFLVFVAAFIEVWI